MHAPPTLKMLRYEILNYFHPIEGVPRYRDPQLQLGKINLLIFVYSEKNMILAQY